MLYNRTHFPYIVFPCPILCPTQTPERNSNIKNHVLFSKLFFQGKYGQSFRRKGNMASSPSWTTDILTVINMTCQIYISSGLY